jgi:polar amino acid transport system substrate-binding protein
MRTVIALLGLWCALSTPPAAAQNYLPGIADLIASGELKVGMFSADAPPMIVTDAGGRTGGYDARIAEAIAKALGIKLTIIRTEKTANALIEQVARGDVDIAVSYVSRTPARALKVLFTRPYLKQNYTLLMSRAFAAQRGSGCPTAKAFFDEVVDTPVGIIEESSDVGSVLHVQPKANLVRFGSFEEMMEGVRTGVVKQAFQGEVTVHHYLADHPAMRVFTQVCEFSGWTDDISIAVNGQKPDLVTFLNVLLDHVVILADHESTSLTIDPWYNE